jgi:hypothetical protein
MEANMQWFVVLAGAHWRQVSPEVFQPHSRVDEWSQLFCDSIDASGPLVELRKGDSVIFLPQAAVVVAVQLGAKKATMGFVAADDGNDCADH